MMITSPGRTISSILEQANSHVICHHAIINYTIDRLETSIWDESFGYNTATPSQVAN